jgi:hypothetical protein
MEIKNLEIVKKVLSGIEKNPEETNLAIISIGKELDFFYDIYSIHYFTEKNNKMYLIIKKLDNVGFSKEEMFISVFDIFKKNKENLELFKYYYFFRNRIIEKFFKE